MYSRSTIDNLRQSSTSKHSLRNNPANSVEDLRAEQLCCELKSGTRDTESGRDLTCYMSPKFIPPQKQIEKPTAHGHSSSRSAVLQSSKSPLILISGSSQGRSRQIRRSNNAFEQQAQPRAFMRTPSVHKKTAKFCPNTLEVQALSSHLDRFRGRMRNEGSVKKSHKIHKSIVHTA